VKYKRVFPAGRFSTPIVFWAGLLFSVKRNLADYYFANNDEIARYY